MKENRAVSNVVSYNSGHYARERLKNILMADRIGCTPDVVTRIRDDMRKCVAAYVNIDSANDSTAFGFIYHCTNPGCRNTYEKGQRKR